MAKFLTFIKIGAISDDNDYLGLSPDSLGGTVINTLDKNIVYRIELSNQKQLQSWTTEKKLSHKVIYDYNSKKYVGVFGRQLRCWGEEEKEIPKARIKLPKELEEIISFDGKHTILVYKDGTCESLESRSENREADCPPIVDDKHQITNVACFNTLDGRVMMTYFLRTKTTMEFVYFVLNSENLAPTKHIHRIKIARKESTLSAFTVVEGEKYPNLMTIWSDKRIFMLSCDENTSTEIGQFVVMFNCLRVDKPLTFVSVSKNCVAIYGANTKQDGASLILYNTRHHIVQSMQHFKVHLDNCRLWVIGKYILMAVGQLLSCARFHISQENLSDIIGSKRSIEWNGHVNKDCINEEGELEDNVHFNKKATRKKIHYVQAAHKVYSPGEPQFPNTFDTAPEIFESFENHLESLYHFDIAVDIIQDSSQPDSMKVRPAVYPNDQPYCYEGIESLAETLESRGASETEITETLIPSLIKAESPDQLAICLRRYTNISERMLAESLKYFISMDKSDEQVSYINKVFACSFDKELIKAHLRTNLNLDNAIYLLELIHRHLRDADFLLEESPQHGHNFDSDTALINWFIVILDAHYQQFLLSRDPAVNEKIETWKTLIEEFVRDIRNLRSATAKLTYLLSGKQKPNGSTSSKFYSVEKVRLY